jgi:hypothetical protein
MHTVMWTFKVPAGTSKAQLIETINATAHTYEGIPGLIRKYYGITPSQPATVSKPEGAFLISLLRRDLSSPHPKKSRLEDSNLLAGLNTFSPNGVWE